MRLATWNVNGLRSRLDFVKHWLQARQPDVVGFQELKLTDDQFPAHDFKELGYEAVVHGQKSWNGVAILSRHPLELIDKGLDDEMGSRFIAAKVNGIGFSTVYVPNGKSVSHDDYPKKLAWFDQLNERMGRGDLNVICGDFNIVPQPIDTYKEAPDQIFHTPEERQRLSKLVDLGYEDVFRVLHPDKKMFSWWDYRGGSFHRNLGLRIDFILADSHIRERATAIEIDRDYRKKKDGMTASDHAPVMLDLQA